LSEEKIKAIFNLPYLKTKVKGLECRRHLAKDCFILSFSLMEMNSANLYNATEYDGEYDSSMRITDLYIEKDFTSINEANFKLIDYIFGNKAT